MSFERHVVLLATGLLLAAIFLGACGDTAGPGLPVADEAPVGEQGTSARGTAAGNEEESAAPGAGDSTTAGSTTAGSTTAESPAAGSTGAASAAPPDGVGAGEAPVATPALALAAPSELLDSYRLAASFIVTSVLPGGERRIESTQLQGAWRRTDGSFGYDAAFTLTNVSGSRRQELGVVALGDAVAIQSDGVWSTIARDDTLLYDDPDRLLSLPFIARINRGEDLGQESLGGVEVTHYRLTDPMTFAAAVDDIAAVAPGSVQNVLLEGWVADAGYVVKYLLEAQLSDAAILDDTGRSVRGQQEVSATYLLSDLDAVPRIEWPADAQPPDTVSVPGFVPNTFPLPENAAIIPRLGMVEIRTVASEGDMAAFYQARLTELGWSFDGELGFYSAEKDGQRISLTILPDEVTGETVVRVFGARQ